MEMLAVRRDEKRTRMSRDGECRVEGCSSPIKAKRYCEKHYARILRTGTLKLKRVRVNREKISNCLVFNCKEKAGRRGYCDKHYSYWQKHKTPFKPKTIKLCGVEGCDNAFYSKGLCNVHYQQFKQKLREIGSDEF